jgi:hypothetical protein
MADGRNVGRVGPVADFSRPHLPEASLEDTRGGKTYIGGADESSFTLEEGGTVHSGKVGDVVHAVVDEPGVSARVIEFDGQR